MGGEEGGDGGGGGGGVRLIRYGYGKRKRVKEHDFVLILLLLFFGWLYALVTSQCISGTDLLCTCCHTQIEVVDQTIYLTQSRFTDTGPISPSADPMTPGAWQDSHWSFSHWYDWFGKIPTVQAGIEPGV